MVVMCYLDWLQNFDGIATLGKSTISITSNSPSCRQLDEQRDDGNTCLHLFAKLNLVRIAEIFIQKGKANMDLQNLQLETPLHIAADRQYYELVRVLVREKCNLNIQNWNGDTPLHIVLRNRLVVSQLLNGKRVFDDFSSLYGSELIGIPYDKNSDAFFACFLVSNGADLNIKNNLGLTPLDRCFDPTLRKVLQRCRNERVCEQSATPANATPAVDDDCNSDIDIHKLTQDQQDELTCPVCLDRVKDVLFDCGHATCQACSDRLLKCPMCRNFIRLRALVKETWLL